MNNKSKGSALAQYGIVIAIIALGCFAGYLLYGKSIQDALTKYLAGQTDLSTQMEANANIASNNVPSTLTPKAGSLGGTPTNPKEDCDNGSCTVDYGDFILNGIPEDFQEFTEAQGTSGGTDKLAAVINQLADQLEEDGQLAEAQELRNFANLLSFIADIESDIVDQIKTCPSTSDPASCFNNNLDGLNISIPTELSDNGVLTSITSPNLMTNTELQMMLNIGDSVSSYKSGFVQSDERIGSALVSIFDSIQTSPNYSSQMKNVIKNTYSTASTLSMSTFMQMHDLTFGVKSSVFCGDIFTGVPNAIEYSDPNATFSTLQHPPKDTNPTLNIP